MRRSSSRREKQDAAYAAARAEIVESRRLWRAAGGWWDGADDIRAPEEFHRLRAAEDRYHALSRSALERVEELLNCPLERPSQRADWLDDAIAWLAEDHFAYRTGFAKPKLHRRIRRYRLDTDQTERLGRVLVEVIQRGKREEFREVCRTAPHVDSQQFRSDLNELIENGAPGTQERASRLLDRCMRATSLLRDDNP
jgi:hypothetical protein